MPLHIVLHQPEIPQNTGNIARTCAATGAKLHLIEPLGFSVDEKAVRRAGLDYWHLVDMTRWPSLDAFLDAHGEAARAGALFPVSTKGGRRHSDLAYPGECFLVFGRESAGLPAPFLEAFAANCVRIPMRDEARSLNLSNAVAILAYEVLRQQGFPGLIP